VVLLAGLSDPMGLLLPARRRSCALRELADSGVGTVTALAGYRLVDVYRLVGEVLAGLLLP